MSCLPRAVARAAALVLENEDKRRKQAISCRDAVLKAMTAQTHVSEKNHGIPPLYKDGWRVRCSVEARATEFTRPGARERRAQKTQRERRRREEEDDKYPKWASILENACKDDEELREIIGDSIGNPEEMKKRVEGRVLRKGKEILQPKSGSAVPMEVNFRDFNSQDDFIWLELRGAPTEKNIDIIGSVFRSWYVLGRLGSFNSMNMQLTKLPIHQPLTYSTDAAKEAMPAFFHNIGDLEFQDNMARIWVDMGTSDPVAMDVLVSGLSTVSSDYVGIKQLVFGGKRFGDWEENMRSEEDGYRSFKI